MFEQKCSVKYKDSLMTAEKRPGLFPFFMQGDRLTREDCAALGLTDRRQLEELFSGRVWGDSAPGEEITSCFTIAAPAASAASSKGKTFKAGGRETGNGESESGSGSTSPSFNILIAEDNLINQKLILQLLKNMGLAADLVENGVQVLEALEQKQYDLVLMDIQMPEMDGEEAAKKIFEKYKNGERPRIVAVTAHALPGDREKYLGIGMDDYISKPIDSTRFKERIIHWSSIGRGSD